MITRKQKLLRSIPGVIVGSIMISIIVWGVTEDKKCNELLEKEDCVQQMVFCKYSEKTFRGNGGYEISTGFINLDDTSQNITTRSFIRPLPKGLPIIIRYSLNSKKCYKFLWDSTIVFKGHIIRFFQIKNQGMDYEIKKYKN